MSDTDKNAETETARNPSHIAYQVRTRPDSQSVWTRIGGAWPHADGQGFNIRIEAVPLDGTIVLRVPTTLPQV